MAVVERGGESWTFALREGPAPDLAWVGDRPRRWAWEATGEGTGRLVLDGAEHALAVATEARHRVAFLTARGADAAAGRDIHAPMPGLVLAVEAEEGKAIAAGDGIVIIEAMKMENEITAPIAGCVRGLTVRVGQAVEANALLCRIEPTLPEPA